jgi:alpha-tubulin suppressor-like RCC1 family protein
MEKIMSKRYSLVIIILICVIGGLFCLGAKSCTGRNSKKTKTGSSIDGFMINAPSNLSATATSISEIQLTWQDNSNNEDGFEIYLSIDGITYTPRATVGVNVISYSDTGLTPFTTYYYRVRAMNTIGDRSTWSNEVNVVLKPIWSAIAVGGYYTFARTTDGRLWAWGLNAAGQLGIGDNDNRDFPTLIENDDQGIFADINLITTGLIHALACKTNGTIWSWGQNDYGQLGLGDTISANFPFQISTDSDWVEITVGSAHTLALKTNGTLWAWGLNGWGQLGLGDGVDRYTPSQIGTDSDWSIAFTAGSAHTLALKTNGTLWAWGGNESGQLGDGTGMFRITPEQISIESDWSYVVAGQDHTLAIKTDGTLWGWGANGNDQLGRSGNNEIPGYVGTESDWSSVAAGESHSLGIKTNGTSWSWGNNAYGQLGRAGDLTRPGQIGIGSAWQSIDAGTYHTIALKTNGTLWSWGNNQYGQLGLGDTIDRNTPTLVGE